MKPAGDASRPERPRVLQCIPRVDLGGSERVAINLARALGSDFEFEFFAVRGKGRGAIANHLERELEDMGVRVHLGWPPLPMRLGGLLTSALQLGRIIARRKFSLVHVHTEIPEAALAALISLRPRVQRLPSVRTLHNTVLWQFSPALGNWADRQLWRALPVGVSAGAVQAFETLRGQSGAPASPWSPRLIYNGVAAPHPIGAKTCAADLRVVFGGRLEHQKGADLLPEILARTRPAHGPATLVIFGAGTFEPQLRALRAAPPNGWRVEVHPPAHSFADQLAAFDLCLMPSRYEGLGLVAVESLLAGVPVVATQVAGLDEVFPPDCPWLAAPGDAAEFAAVLQRGIDGLMRRDFCALRGATLCLACLTACLWSE